MQIRMEMFEPCVKEIDEIIRDYWHKTPAHKGVPPLDFNWPLYIESNKNERLLLVTARDNNGKMQGFVMYFIMRHPHHRTMLWANCDTLATRVEARGKGYGTRLVNTAEKLLQARGVKFVTHNFRTCYRTKPLFPKLGYELMEYSYMKELDA